MAKVLVQRPAFLGSLHDGIKQGLYAYLALLKIMAPVYIIIALLKQFQVVGYLANIFAPYMNFFGLPGEAALVIVSGWTVNLYGAIAALAGLSFNVRQVTILATILGISHSLIMETAIISRMKGRPLIILAIRMSLGLVAGLIMNAILPANL